MRQSQHQSPAPRQPKKKYNQGLMIGSCFATLTIIVITALYMYVMTNDKAASGATNSAQSSSAMASSSRAASSSTFDYPEMDFSQFFPNPPVSVDVVGVSFLAADENSKETTIRVFNDTPLLIDVQQLAGIVNKIPQLLAQDRPDLSLRHPREFVFLFSKEKYVIPIAFDALAAQGERDYQQFFRTLFTSYEVLALVEVAGQAGTSDGFAKVIRLTDGEEIAFVALAMGNKLSYWQQQKPWTDGRRAYDPNLKSYIRASGRAVQHLNLVHELIHCWTSEALPYGREDEAMVYSLDDVYTQRLRPSVFRLP